MANMGYVRFENTLSDLRDCSKHQFDDLSEREQKCRDELLLLAVRMLEEEGVEVILKNSRLNNF